MASARCGEYQLVRGVFTVAINLPIIMLAPYSRQPGSLALLLGKCIYCSALIAGGISPPIKYGVKPDIAVEMRAHSQAGPEEMKIEQRGMDAIGPYRARLVLPGHQVHLGACTDTLLPGPTES